MMNVHERSLVTLALPVVEQGDVGGELVTVRFEITLSKCERHKPIWEWSAGEKYQVALRYKERGVELFRDSRIVDAFHEFSRACKILITLEPIPDPDLKLEEQLESDIKGLRLALYNNMAMCQLSRKNYEHVVSLCTKVLDRDRNNVKALYRRGMAHGSMRDNEKAVADLKVALILEPSNCAVKEQFNNYNSKLHESIQRRNDMVRRMFKT
ncbi:Peptidyl-prolyl cis-trans isomerase FKBP4 [Ooceraea biroi]|nr:Peptidyl-prolyl cis-trans isomerase FKBP4 [Ooceraea biroi]